jgi:hypothetical protein
MSFMSALPVPPFASFGVPLADRARRIRTPAA